MELKNHVAMIRRLPTDIRAYVYAHVPAHGVTRHQLQNTRVGKGRCRDASRCNLCNTSSTEYLYLVSTLLSDDEKDLWVPRDELGIGICRPSPDLWRDQEWDEDEVMWYLCMACLQTRVYDEDFETEKDIHRLVDSETVVKTLEYFDFPQGYYRWYPYDDHDDDWSVSTWVVRVPLEVKYWQQTEEDGFFVEGSSCVIIGRVKTGSPFLPI